MEIPDLGSGILDVVARSAVVYLVLLALLRFGGKRHVGQLSIADLVLVLLIANGVQNAMVGENTTLIGGLAAALRWSSSTGSSTGPLSGRIAFAWRSRASRGSSSATGSCSSRRSGRRASPRVTS